MNQITTNLSSVSACVGLSLCLLSACSNEMLNGNMLPALQPDPPAIEVRSPFAFHTSAPSSTKGGQPQTLCRLGKITGDAESVFGWQDIPSTNPTPNLEEESVFGWQDIPSTNPSPDVEEDSVFGWQDIPSTNLSPNIEEDSVFGWQDIPAAQSSHTPSPSETSCSEFLDRTAAMGYPVPDFEPNVIE